MQCRAVVLAFALFSIGCGALGCGAESADGDAPPALHGAPVSTGTLRGWPEATSRLVVELGADGPKVHLGDARASGLDALWSIASTKEGDASGFFYADVFRDRRETRIALAPVAHVGEIRDAAALDFSKDSVGPVPVGTVVVFHHEPSRRYLAIVLDAIAPADPHTAGAGPYAYADVTWYLTAEGSADFSAAR